MYSDLRGDPLRANRPFHVAEFRGTGSRIREPLRSASLTNTNSRPRASAAGVAALAAYVAVWFEKPLAGSFPLSTFLARNVAVEAQAVSANRGLPVFAAHRTQDRLVARARAARSDDGARLRRDVPRVPDGARGVRRGDRGAQRLDWADGRIAAPRSAPGLDPRSLDAVAFETRIRSGRATHEAPAEPTRRSS